MLSDWIQLEEWVQFHSIWIKGDKFFLLFLNVSSLLQAAGLQLPEYISQEYLFYLERIRFYQLDFHQSHTLVKLTKILQLVRVFCYRRTGSPSEIILTRHDEQAPIPFARTENQNNTQ